MQRAAALVAVASLGLLGTASCDGPGAPEADGAPRDTLVIAASRDVNSLLYVVSQAAMDGWVLHNVAATPLQGEFDCRSVYKPYLAESWELLEDGRTLRMKLREDAKWQDGQPLTAADVAFTMDLVADPVVGSPRADHVAKMEPDGRPKVIDDHTIEWRFTEALDIDTMLAQTSLPPVPKHLLESADRATLREHPLNTGLPLASGPWKVTQREKGVKIVLEPNESWWGDPERRPRLARVILKVLPDYATRLLELQNGSVDLMDNVLIADADGLARTHPELRLYRRGWRQVDFVAWNAVDPADWKRVAGETPADQRPDFRKAKPHPIFGDREVRRALALAIDVDELIGDLLTSKVTGEVYGRPAVGTITPALCGAHNDTIRRIGHDPAAAKARLAELGWTDTNADGVLDKDGVPLRFTLLSNAENKLRASSAVILQQQLAAVGVDARLEQLETNTFYERLTRKDYDAALAGWTAALSVDPTVNYGVTSDFNIASYHNPKVDELTARGLAERDEQKANAVWRELQEVVYDDQPYAFLYWQDEIVAVHSRFQDVQIDILAPYRDLWRWSVPPEKVKYR